MPRVPDEYVDSVVYLYPTEEDARDGTAKGGCGFMVRVPLDVEIGNIRPNQLYVVTNRHIVDHGNHWVRLNTLDGGFDVIETKADDWVPHPLGHDVAAASIHFRREGWAFTATLHSTMLTADAAMGWKIGPGDDVFLISRFLAHEGRHRNRPVLHMGVVSRFPDPDEGVLNWHTQLQEPSFLVETQSRPGYSGSPVYGYIDSAQPHLGVERDTTSRIFLLGVAWGYLPAKERLKDAAQSDLPATVTLSSGIAAVAPAWHIQDVLDEQEFVVERKEMSQLVRAQQSQPRRPDEGAVAMNSQGESDEFERFEDLTRKIVHVSKKELDEKRGEDG